MTILQSAARAGINHVYHRRDIHFIRDNPRLTLQVEELALPRTQFPEC
jgi:hypothetical protein